MTVLLSERRVEPLTRSRRVALFSRPDRDVRVAGGSVGVTHGARIGRLKDAHEFGAVQRAVAPDERDFTHAQAALEVREAFRRLGRVRCERVFGDDDAGTGHAGGALAWAR